MFFATIFMLAGIFLLPYFIFLKVTKLQPTFLPDILKYKKRVGAGILAGFLVFSGLANAALETQETPISNYNDDFQSSQIEFENKIKEAEDLSKKAEEESKKQAEEKKVQEKAIATSEIKKSGLFSVVDTIDGDTLSINYHGKVEKVRLVGLDTPETKHPSKPVQCFGKEASAKLKELISGKSVYIEFDTTQGQRDKYGRLLLFIFTEDGQNVAHTMIYEGYGNEYTYNSKPYKYQTQFRNAQASAREAGRGLWAQNTCGGDAKKPTQQNQPQPKPTPQPQRPQTPQKPHSTPARPQPQPAPTRSQSVQSQPEQPQQAHYKNCAAVRAAGRAPIYAGQPGYGSHLDRDGDGVACEK